MKGKDQLHSSCSYEVTGRYFIERYPKGMQLPLVLKCFSVSRQGLSLDSKRPHPHHAAQAVLRVLVPLPQPPETLGLQMWTPCHLLGSNFYPWLVQCLPSLSYGLTQKFTLRQSQA